MHPSIGSCYRAPNEAIDFKGYFGKSCTKGTETFCC